MKYLRFISSICLIILMSTLTVFIYPIFKLCKTPENEKRAFKSAMIFAVRIINIVPESDKS